MSSPNPDRVLAEVVDPAARPVRRTFTVQYRNRLIDEYERAPHGEKSALLRREGLYQSQLREWTLARDAQPVPKHRRRAGKAGAGAVSAAAAGDAGRAARRDYERLERENSRLAARLTRTEAALDIMGKVHVLLESISKSTDTGSSSRTP
jgi:transposase